MFKFANCNKRLQEVIYAIIIHSLPLEMAIWLVVSSLLKNRKVNWGMSIPKIWRKMFQTTNELFIMSCPSKNMEIFTTCYPLVMTNSSLLKIAH